MIKTHFFFFQNHELDLALRLKQQSSALQQPPHPQASKQCSNCPGVPLLPRSSPVFLPVG